MQWLPIESAPKDGARILAFGEIAGEISGPSGESEVAVIYWNGGRTDWKGYQWDVAAGDTYACWMRPIKWMHIPDTGGCAMNDKIEDRLRAAALETMAYPAYALHDEAADTIQAMREALEAYVAAYDSGTGTVYVNDLVRKALGHG
jgi:hypothetical protein